MLIDRAVAVQVRIAVAVPLVIPVIGQAGVLLVSRFMAVTPVAQWAAAAGGLAVAALVGGLRAVQVERARAVEFRKLADVVASVEKTVLWSTDEVCRGGRPPVPETEQGSPRDGTGEVGAVVVALEELRLQAVAAVLRVHDESQATLLVSMLHHLSRREHALIGRALTLLDKVQGQTEDPDLLDGLYKLDHLVTRMRRLVESKAALAGESLRSARQPVSVTEALRGALQEVEQYARVSVAPGTVGVELGLPRHVGPDLSHLLAELVENATEFSRPGSKVRVASRRIAAGLLIEVEDEPALAMAPELRAELNALLADPGHADVGLRVSEGRIGLLTAATIAARYRMAVRLLESPTQGTLAQVVVPDNLLVPMAAPVTQQHTAPVPPAGPAFPAGQPRPVPPRRGDCGGGPPALPRRTASGPLPLPQSQPGPAARGPARTGLMGDFQAGTRAARAQHPPADDSRYRALPKPPSTHP